MIDILSGFTLGSLFVGVAADIIADEIPINSKTMLSGLRSSALPKNHHVQRAVRKSYLQATALQLQTYQKTLEKHDDGVSSFDLISDVHTAYMHFRRPTSKSLWKPVQVLLGSSTDIETQVNNIDIANIAIDFVTNGEMSVKDASQDIKKQIIANVQNEVCAVLSPSWTQCPADFIAQLNDEKSGWFASFASYMSDALKHDQEYHNIYQAMMLRMIQNENLQIHKTIRSMELFAKSANQALTEKLERLEALILENNGSKFDYIELEKSFLNLEGNLTNAMLKLPFGRRYLAQDERNSHKQTVEKLTQFFVGRTHELNEIEAFVQARMDGRNKGLLIYTAPAGIGKSALAANYCLWSASAPNRRVVSHFCRISSGDKTTRPDSVYDHILEQISDIYDFEADLSNSKDILVGKLQEKPPDDQQIVIWLDGLDEAQGDIDTFIPDPTSLAENVCVIVSARAEKGTTPTYLMPWLIDERAKAYDPFVLHLDHLSRDDVDEMTSEYFGQDEEGLSPPSGLVDKVFKASDSGYTLFVREMLRDALEDAKLGKDTDFGEAPVSLEKYIRAQISRLVEDRKAKWEEFEDAFVILTQTKEAVSRHDLSSILGNRFPSFNSLPPKIYRWLSVYEPHDTRQPSLIGMAHPKLAESFGKQLDPFVVSDCLTSLIENLFNPPETLTDYALRHLPAHLIDNGERERAASMLMTDSFIDERFKRLGTEIATDNMVRDWSKIGYNWHRD